MYKGSHNAKVLQLDQQHEVPKFQDCSIYYEKIHEKIGRTFFIDLNIYQIPISVLTLLKLKNKQCQK